MNWWNIINDYAVGIVILLCILALIFICIGHVYRDQVQMVLKQEFFKFPECSIDYWSLTHFILYAIFGFLIPSYPLTFFMLGAGFEFAEDCLSSDATTQLVDCMSANNKANNFICQYSINDGYWYMAYFDVFANLSGYIVGSAVRTTFF